MEWSVLFLIAAIVAGVIAVAFFYWKLNLWRLPIRPVFIWPREMGILNILGAPDRYLDSGLWWISLFPGCYVEKFKRTMWKLDYLAREAVTRPSSPGEKKRGEHFGSQVVTVNSTAYVSLPSCFAWVRFKVNDREEIKTVNSRRELQKLEAYLAACGVSIKARGGLVEILRRGVPTDEPGLRVFSEKAVVAAIRVAVGMETWKTVTRDIEKIRRGAEDVFRSSDGALLTAGFHPDALMIAVEEIKLPKKLEEALPGPDIARLEFDAAGFVSQTRAIETVGTVIEMMAQSRGKTLREIREEIDKDDDIKREFLDLSVDLIKRRMSLEHGALVDIHVDGAEGAERALLNIAAAWKRMPDGGKGSASAPTPEKGGGQASRSFSNLTPQEREGVAAERRRLIGKS